jgi:hypothetical protein
MAAVRQIPGSRDARCYGTASGCPTPCRAGWRCAAACSARLKAVSSKGSHSPRPQYARLPLPRSVLDHRHAPDPTRIADLGCDRMAPVDRHRDLAAVGPQRPGRGRARASDRAGLMRSRTDRRGGLVALRDHALAPGPGVGVACRRNTRHGSHRRAACSLSLPRDIHDSVVGTLLPARLPRGTPPAAGPGNEIGRGTAATLSAEAFVDLARTVVKDSLHG